MALDKDDRARLIDALLERGWQVQDDMLLAPRRTMWLRCSDPWQGDLTDMLARMQGRLARARQFENDDRDAEAWRETIDDVADLVDALAGLVGDAAAIRLVDPSQAWRGEFLDMAQEWRDSGIDRYARALEDFDGYLEQLGRDCDVDRVPPHLVPRATFWLEHAGVIVGCVRLRYRLNVALEQEGGHVGYDVRPSARRRGFGTQALRLVLPEARARGISNVLVTTDADNVASIRIIEKNGGILSGETISAESGKLIRRYWIAIPARPL
jgi:predicted acetyltransferase